MNAREVAALVPMVRLLGALGFEAREKPRRCACILHGGSNRSAFSWTEAGLWKCHSCGAGGDRIALVRAVRNCDFHAALEFLGLLVGVQYSPRPASRREIACARASRERTQAAAWQLRDEVLRLRSYYRDGLHRSERLTARMAEVAFSSSTQAEKDRAWELMARLAPVQGFFYAGYDFHCRASNSGLVRFTLASSEQRRTLILRDNDANFQLQAA
jgi:phage/plasmid primase-like uncharacterized protein